ncbi:probable zinc transporter 10 [Tanacetum coccineum]|uniref:Probable zinc transporter 10 n=1 Tax=Tanacetum coccineum TaxID=301880 RepID=A0ABQ4ZB83_9ASTR
MISVFLIFMVFLCTKALSQCEDETNNPCNNKSKALNLKIIGIATILITSIIGVCLPLITRSVPALSPDRSLFVIVKAFASGIILATAFMHVLCCYVSAIFTLMVDSMVTSIYTKKNNAIAADHGSEVVAGDHEKAITSGGGVNFHGHHHGQKGPIGQQLLRYRVVAMVLELGIVVHSIVIGLGLGASNDVCTIKPLVAALCFHQMFEGMGLGGCILQGEVNSHWFFFFSITTPFGIALGIALSKTYKENSPSALITVGLLNASSAGLLINMALVDLLSADFMGLANPLALETCKFHGGIQITMSHSLYSNLVRLSIGVQQALDVVPGKQAAEFCFKGNRVKTRSLFGPMKSAERRSTNAMYISSPADEALSNPTVIKALGLFSLYVFDKAIPRAIPNGVVIEKKKTMTVLFTIL